MRGLEVIDVRGDKTIDLPRPQRAPSPDQRAAVREILDAVRSGGDAAVITYTGRFDGVELDSVAVPRARIDAALGEIEPELRLALEAAAEQIDWFQRHAAGATREIVERNGIRIESWRQPVDRVGCYVPGGRAVYPSTVLMTAIPARAAGVGQIVLCVPPGVDGEVPAVVLAAAAVAGVDAVFRIGGAQAVAAMAFGTESVPAVDVIVGPGNLYVALAKQEVAGTVGVPSAFAGPSEIVVVVDGSVDPRFAALDLLVQAEHGPDGLAWLVGWDPLAVSDVVAAVDKELAAAARVDDIAATLADNGFAVICDDLAAAARIVNEIAPEHLQLMVDPPDELLGRIRHAGAIFCGPWSPAAVGDYYAGPSHVLPTHGTARFSGALGMSDFTKPMHAITMDRDAVTRVAPVVERMALAEGLPAHAQALRARRGTTPPEDGGS